MSIKTIIRVPLGLTVLYCHILVPPPLIVRRHPPSYAMISITQEVMIPLPLNCRFWFRLQKVREMEGSALKCTLSDVTTVVVWCTSLGSRWCYQHTAMAKVTAAGVLILNTSVSTSHLSPNLSNGK